MKKDLQLYAVSPKKTNFEIILLPEFFIYPLHQYAQDIWQSRTLSSTVFSARHIALMLLMTIISEQIMLIIDSMQIMKQAADILFFLLSE